ncbi:MAG: GerMN domain-containing protein [Rhodoglobus sp.]
MRRKPAVVVAAIALVLALAGCVGIPSSGGVQVGPIVNDPDNAEVEFVVSGPQDDATQDEILAGFMQAVRAPQSNFAIARLFFTKEMAGSWDPDAGTLIRSGIATTTIADAPDTLAYTVTTGALVDNRGRYTEPPPAAQTLTFSFAQENGQWRISDAPPGIILSRSSFNLVFDERSLYFFDQSYRYLVPEVRWFAKRSNITRDTVSALLAGPSDWLAQAGVTAFPQATTLESVSVQSAQAIVDLSKEVIDSTPVARDQMRQQLVATLGIANVVISVGGTELATPAASGSDAIIPTVDSAALVGTDTAFGFNGGGGIANVPGVSNQVVAAEPTAATLSQDKSAAVILAADGVSLASVGANAVTLLDGRAGLIRPSIDPLGYVWSARGASAASLLTIEADRTEHTLQSGLPDDSSIVSMAVSRDGARLLVYLATPVGPRLAVAGIVRQEGVPVRLGQLFDLPTPQGAPVDATWVDDKSVATLSGAGVITLVEIGGPTLPLGQLDGAVSIAGGTAGTDGLRVLSDGEVWRSQGTGWVPTGIAATLLATKQ